MHRDAESRKQRRRLRFVLAGFAFIWAAGGVFAVTEAERRRFGLTCALSYLSPLELSYSQLRARAAAGNGDTHRWAQQRLLEVYTYAEGGICLPRDDEKYLAFVKETAEQGWAESQYVYAVIAGGMGRFSSAAAGAGRGHGLVLPAGVLAEMRDARAAFSHLTGAAEKGVHYAQHMLIGAYAAGRWGDTDAPYWREWSQYGADAGESCDTRGRDDGGVLCTVPEMWMHAEWGEDAVSIGRDFALSMEWAERAGHYYDLAVRHRYGKYGAPRDDAKAYALFAKSAAEYDDAAAMAQLAWMRAQGAGAEKDMDAAREWMRRAVRASPPEVRGVYERWAAELR